MGNVRRKFPAHAFRHVICRHIAENKEHPFFPISQFRFCRSHPEWIPKERHRILAGTFRTIGTSDSAKKIFIMIEKGNAAEALVFFHMKYFFYPLIIIDNLFPAVQKNNPIRNSIQNGTGRISFFFNIFQIVFYFIMLFFHLVDEGHKFFIFIRQPAYLFSRHNVLYNISQAADGTQDTICFMFRRSKASHGKNKKEKDDFRNKIRRDKKRNCF